MTYESLSEKVGRGEEEEDLQFEVTHDGTPSTSSSSAPTGKGMTASNSSSSSSASSPLFYYSRWAVLAASMAVAYGAGSAYDYGLYSDIVEKNLDYSESEIAFIGSVANAGLYSMIISGIVLEFIGPRYTLLIGGVCSAIGYLFLWGITEKIVSSEFYQTCLAMYLATFGSSFFSIAVTTLTVTNFPLRDRGKVVGLIKAFLGVGIFINTQFYSSFFESLDYLLGLAIMMPLIALIGGGVVNYIPKKELEYKSYEVEESGKPNFRRWFYLVIVTALYIGTIVYFDEYSLRAKYALKEILFIPTLLLIALGMFLYPVMYGPFKKQLDPSWNISGDRYASLGFDALVGAGSTKKRNTAEGENNASFDDESSNLLFENVKGSKSVFGYITGYNSTVPGMEAYETAARKLFGGDDRKGTSRSGDGEGNNEDNGKQNNNDASFVVVDRNAPGPNSRQLTEEEARKRFKNRTSNRGSDDFDDDEEEQEEIIIYDPYSGENNHTLGEMLITGEFWMIFLIFLVAAGTCLTVLNNIAALVDAFDSAEGTAVPIMMFGFFETAGRLSISISDFFKSYLVRVFMIDFILLIILGCCLLLAFADLYSLNVAVVIISYCYGFLYANFAAIIADLFGVQHFGPNLGFSLFAPILGSFALSSGLVTLLYEDGCSGSSCFRYVFSVDAMLILMALFLSILLKFKLMEKYNIRRVQDIFALKTKDVLEGEDPKTRRNFAWLNKFVHGFASFGSWFPAYTPVSDKNLDGM